MVPFSSLARHLIHFHFLCMVKCASDLNARGGILLQQVSVCVCVCVWICVSVDLCVWTYIAQVAANICACEIM